MTDTTTSSTGDELLDELHAFLDQNWDPDLTLAEWWERLGLSGWAAPLLPPNAYGRGLSRSDAVRVSQEIARYGAVGAPSGLGLLLAAPTIAEVGTQAQIDLYVRDIVTGQKAWCQLFSEPGAGSDLAGLTTRAVQDGDEWVINGQKVWTSGGQYADLGMLLARTDPDVPKHQGITYFAFPMHQDGVEVRPLREMTGRALFNEVFLTEARVADSGRIGERGHGWKAANITLGHERAGLGAGGGGGAGGAIAGTVAGNLQRRAGDFTAGAAGAPKRRRASAGVSPRALLKLAKANGTITEPVIRQGLMKLYTLGEIGRYNSERAKVARASGGEIRGIANIAKLSMSEMLRLTRDLSLAIVGPLGTLHAYDDESRAALDEITQNPALESVTETALLAQGPQIYGGTDQIQHNILGERALGLPKEPSDDKTAPFSSLPKNG